MQKGILKDKHCEGLGPCCLLTEPAIWYLPTVCECILPPKYLRGPQMYKATRIILICIVPWLQHTAVLCDHFPTS